MGSGTYLLRAIKKYGKENFIRRRLCFCETVEEAREKEAFYIQQYNTLFPNGYNISPRGGLGYRDSFSEEMKQTMRDNHADYRGEKHPRFGTHHTEESNKKNSETHKAFFQTEEGMELRKKWCVARKGNKNSLGKPSKYKGVPRPPEVRKKISEGQKGRIQDPEAIEKGRQTRIKTMSKPEVREKYRIAALKQWEQPGYKEKQSGENHPMFGKHHSEESCKKMSVSHKDQIPWNKGVPSEKSAWNKGLTKADYTEYKQQKKVV